MGEAEIEGRGAGEVVAEEGGMVVKPLVVGYAEGGEGVEEEGLAR